MKKITCVMLCMISMMFFGCTRGVNEPEVKDPQTETPGEKPNTEDPNKEDPNKEDPNSGNNGQNDTPQEALKVEFTAELQEDGITVQFTDKTPGAKSWSWNFGDGQTSTQRSPKHTYPVKGDLGTQTMYTVTVTVTDDKGRTGEGMTIVFTMNKSPKILTLKITWADLLSYPTVGETVNFDALSSSLFSNPTYKWEFGDGTSSNEQKTTHKYTKEGTYQVKFTITDKGGSASKTASITVVKAPAGEGRLAYIKIQTLNLSKNWDFGSGPDVYVELYKENTNTNLGMTSADREEDVTSNDLPIYILMSKPLDITSRYIIKIYDYDPVGSDELMATMTLDVPTMAKNWQEEVTLSNNGCSVEACVVFF